MNHHGYQAPLDDLDNGVTHLGQGSRKTETLSDIHTKWSDQNWKVYLLLHEQEINFYLVYTDVALGFYVTCSQGLASAIKHGCSVFITQKHLAEGEGWGLKSSPCCNQQTLGLDMGCVHLDKEDIPL